MAKPEIWAVLGARGAGKSSWIKSQLARSKPARLAVWDLMAEHDAAQQTGQLGEALRAMAARKFSVAFRPAGEPKARAAQFELWCRGVMAAAKEGGPLVALVEELRFVTTPSRAPEPWAAMTLLGRHHGVTIIGTSQRPASIDKDFLGNADLIHAGRQAYPADARAVAEVLAVDPDELLRLPDLQWIERRVGETEARRGVMSFAPKGRAPQGKKVTRRED